MNLVPPTGQTPDVSPSKESETSGDDVISEESLRAMSYLDIVRMCQKNGVEPPVEIDKQEDLVDWLLGEFGT